MVNDVKIQKLKKKERASLEFDTPTPPGVRRTAGAGRAAKLIAKPGGKNIGLINE